MGELRPISSRSRDFSWGADCDRCEMRLDAAQAERAWVATPGDVLLCGSCRDEEYYETRISDLEAAINKARGLVFERADHKDIWDALYVSPGRHQS